MSFPQNYLKNPKLREKLFRISISPRPLHKESEIVLPNNSGAIEKEQLFRPGKHRRTLELGSGSGEFLTQWLKEYPEDDYTAFEIKTKRIRKTLHSFHKANTTSKLHLKIVPINFNWFLEDLLPPKSFDIVIINFPDPWPKYRHWKHRLVQEGFDKRIAVLLRKQAQVRLSTDYGPYARKILSLFRKSPYFRSSYPPPHYLRERPEGLPTSRFEELFIKKGRHPYYFSWEYIQ